MKTACSELLLSPRENTQGWSPLFTQLAPWKGLLNMKYEMSSEIRGRELERNKGMEPSVGGGAGGALQRGS